MIPENPSELSDEDDVKEEDTAHVQHAVTYMCIRCTRDVKYQRTLEHINELHMTGELELENTHFRIKLEPENPVDPRALSIQSYADCRWQIVGYIVNLLPLSKIRGFYHM